jgi:hypothetical protein
MKTDKHAQDCEPWWKHGHVWLLILAGIATAVIAVRGSDPVVEADYYRRGIEINKTLAAGDKSQLPAMQGRNHAVTPARQ